MYKSKFCNVKQTKQILENGVSDVLFKVYHKNKGRRKRRMKNGAKKYSLAQIGKDLAMLNQKVDNGFKQVNSRIDRIEERLDYNNLKKLPTNSK